MVKAKLMLFYYLLKLFYYLEKQIYMFSLLPPFTLSYLGPSRPLEHSDPLSSLLQPSILFLTLSKGSSSASNDDRITFEKAGWPDEFITYSYSVAWPILGRS